MIAFLLSLLRFAIAQTVFILWSSSTYHTFYKIRYLSVLRISKSFAIILSHLSLLCLCGKWNLIYCNVTVYNSGSRYFIRRHYLLSVFFWIQSPTLPCTFISMICHLSHCFFTISTELLMVRLAAGLEHGRVYANVGGVTIIDSDCYLAVCVLWFAYFSVVFFYSQDLHKEETMVFEAHGMSFPCTELLLFNYAKVNIVFHSMAPLSETF